jgi:lysozyme family protein
MSDFNKSEPYILLAEGGFLQDKDGLTYEGLCEKDTLDFEGWPIIKAAMPLSRNEIIPDPKLAGMIDTYYKCSRWDKVQGDLINKWKFATYLYDWYVNSQAKAVMRLQEILGIDQTGHLGPVTLAAINAGGDDLLDRYHARRLQFYHDHVLLVPEDAHLLNGWVNRCMKLYNELSEAE